MYAPPPLSTSIFCRPKNGGGPSRISCLHPRHPPPPPHHWDLPLLLKVGSIFYVVSAALFITDKTINLDFIDGLMISNDALYSYNSLWSSGQNRPDKAVLNPDSNHFICPVTGFYRPHCTGLSFVMICC